MLGSFESWNIFYIIVIKVSMCIYIYIYIYIRFVLLKCNITVNIFIL